MNEKLTNEQIERMARAYCRHLGIDPDGLMGHGYADALTDGELATDPIIAHGGTMPLVAIYSPRWMLRRRDVVRAWAMRLALNEEEGK